MTLNLGHLERRITYSIKRTIKTQKEQIALVGSVVLAGLAGTAVTVTRFKE